MSIIYCFFILNNTIKKHLNMNYMFYIIQMHNMYNMDLPEDDVEEELGC